MVSRLPLSQARWAFFDVGFIQGVTIAEQLRTFGGKMFRLEAHLQRLARSLAIVGIKSAASGAELGRIAQIWWNATKTTRPRRRSRRDSLSRPRVCCVFRGSSHTAPPCVCIRSPSRSVSGRQIPHRRFPRGDGCRAGAHRLLAARAKVPQRDALTIWPISKLATSLPERGPFCSTKKVWSPKLPRLTS